jgi:hypothetical protein
MVMNCLTNDIRVWVLGADNPNADKHIHWDSPFPNFADADVLIVNLQSLTKDILERNNDKLKRAAHEIFEKSINQGELIFITAPKITPATLNVPSSYILSPVDFQTQKVSSGIQIKFDENHKFKKYYSQVKYFDFFLFSPVISQHALTGSASSNKMKMINTIVKAQNFTLLGVEEQSPLTVTDNSGRMLSGTFKVFFHDSTIQGYVKCFGSNITYLPPIGEIETIEDGIDIVLDVLGKSTSKEPFPEWVKNIQIEGVQGLVENISKFQDRIDEIENKKRELEDKKESLLIYYRLLASKGNSLTLAVKKAFQLLGFGEIDNPRGDEYEDLRFEFKGIPDYKYAVLEIYGTENRTGLDKLRQCNQYVEDYIEIVDEKVKGIFVVNQERLLPYPEERDKKLFIEPRQLEYCKKQNICIIPTPVLFELVNCFLAGKKKPRYSIEKKIAQCNGVLNEF